MLPRISGVSTPTISGSFTFPSHHHHHLLLPDGEELSFAKRLFFTFKEDMKKREKEQSQSLSISLIPLFLKPTFPDSASASILSLLHRSFGI
ncbi:hypothetical protein L6452_26355 [Arctium lappa]|uniref:Uncharacterized protein n=1 Tax=Arctium lappa TaxID=4217 RepID=A0ACB9ADY9_ARCLA|nr:hypothetical protein L6452_26355 [Arctium lappa]